MLTPQESELGLLGTAWLASDAHFQPCFPIKTIEPGSKLLLDEAYEDWKDWLNQITGS